MLRSGAIGIEALSLGASHCVFVDKNVDYLTKNLEWVSNDYTVHRRRCSQYFKQYQDTFDIIFFDPPWNDLTLYEESLNAIFQNDILKNKGVLIWEYRRSTETLLTKDIPYKTYSYGNTTLAVLINEKSNIRG